MNSHKDMFDLDSIEMKVVRIFLLAFIILFCYQAAQIINLRIIDRQHSKLLVMKNQSFESLQNLLVHSSTIQRKLLNLALADKENETAELDDIIASASRGMDVSLATLISVAGQIDPGSLDEIYGLKRSNEDYKAASVTYRQMINTDRAGALAYRQSTLRPAYESYQESQQQLLLKITNDLVSEGQRISKYTTISGWVLFFLGLAPFVFAITKLIYLMLFLKLKEGGVYFNRNQKDLL